ncbi:MAG: PASTA domain-containing protein [Bacilli bacterium]|nr:PASTA domain-containing protein [Bacilli bacterium]
MKEEKRKTHRVCNLLLLLSFIGVVANFMISILLPHNGNFMIEIINNLLLSIFIIFYTFSQITNRRNNKSTVVIASLLMIGYSLFQIATKLDMVTILKLNQVEDFRDESLVEVIEWSQKNGIKINQIYEYSDLIEEYHIISQSKKEGTLLKDIKELDIVISEGPNPDKEVIIPDMTTWNSKRVLKYIKENKLNHVEVEFQISDKNKDTVIEQSKSGNMKRSDELKLTFSSGEEEQLEDTKLIDFTNMEEFEAIFFLKQHSIKYEIKREFSNHIKRDAVMKQNKKMGTMVKPNDEENKVILTISKGKKIKIPDLSKYNVIEITNWAIKNKLKLEFRNQYDDSVALNKVISVDHKKGDTVEQKTLITVTISKGKLVMQSFKNIDDFRTWANKNKVNYEEKYEFNTEVKEGEIISYSHKKGDTIKNSDTIVITISQGKKVTVPNLVGKTKDDAIKRLKSLSLKYNFVYENNTKPKNTVIKQSLRADSEVSQNTTLTLTISNGKKPNVPSSSTQNNQSPTTTTPSNKPEGCDKSKTVTVTFQGSLNGSSLNETAANYRRAYPNVKFSFVGRASSVGNNGMVHRDSTSKGSFIANTCDTYTIYIVQN